MKKTIIGIGAVFISLLLVSTVTAVPQTHSKPAMNLIEKIEQKKSIDGCIENGIYQKISLRTTGIIDLIIQLLNTILDLIQQLIQFFLDLFQIVNLINAIISAITTLVNIILQFIETIIDIFTPDKQYC